jgi:hypothetical protein
MVFVIKSIISETFPGFPTALRCCAPAVVIVPVFLDQDLLQGVATVAGNPYAVSNPLC